MKWGYIKQNILNKLNLETDEANEYGFLNKFPYYANEGMTQICSIKPQLAYKNIVVDKNNVNKPIAINDKNFISFTQYNSFINIDGRKYQVTNNVVDYYGYNQVIITQEGDYDIAYFKRWFTFDTNIQDSDEVTAPQEVIDALPSYIASQCFKLDDEVKSAVYRNEFELFLSRLDDSSHSGQATFHIRGGW